MTKPYSFDTPETATTAYRDLLGWPVHRSGSIVWMTPGTAAEALNIPASLGQRVLTQLHPHDIDLPVISIPAPPPRYALLTQPHPGPPGEILALFDGLDIGYAHGGKHEGRDSQWGLDLPPTQHPGYAPLRWIRPPDTPLPPLAVVVLALLTALRQQ